MIWVYIAGPYTHPDPVANTRDAILVADRLRKTVDIVPIIPHLSHFWHFLTPNSYSYWMDLGLDMLDKCDCLLRLSGESQGADDEVLYAANKGMPVFYDESKLIRWINELSL